MQGEPLPPGFLVWACVCVGRVCVRVFVSAACACSRLGGHACQRMSVIFLTLLFPVRACVCVCVLLCGRVQTPMSHPALKPVVDPLLALRAVVRGKALMRLKYEGKDKAPELSNPDSKWHNDPEGYAEDLFAYYECFKCKKPYYGGERVCGEAGGAFDPTELVCGACSPWSGDIDCPKHGKDFIEFKCRFCCSVAVRGTPISLFVGALVGVLSVGNGRCCGPVGLSCVGRWALGVGLWGASVTHWRLGAGHHRQPEWSWLFLC